MSRDILRTPEAKAILANRADIVAQTGDMLGRAANIANTIRAQFPYTTLRALDYGDFTGPVRARGLTLPWIVLAARPLTSMTKDEPTFTRNSATKLELVYKAENMPHLDELVYRHMDQPLPKPDEVRFGYAHPIALTADTNMNKKLPHPAYNRSISGIDLDLFAWCAQEFGAQLPHRNLPNSRDNELRDFDIYRDYPEEALVRQEQANIFHRAKLDRFMGCLGETALAIIDPGLNPR